MSTSSTASCAAALLRATMTATASPTWLTVSTAIDGCPGLTMSGVTGQAHGIEPCSSAKSRPVKTATTPGRLLGGAHVDAGDAGVRDGAADDRQVQHPGQDHVVGPGGAPGDQPGVLLAPAGLPISFAGPVVGSSASVMTALPSRRPCRRSSRRPPAARRGRCSGSRYTGRGCPRCPRGPRPRSGSGCRSPGRSRP